ncbi:UNVERIFIED_CONTAM: hypothetical protein RMT77_012438 [Armadillidium vulgare]
MKLLNGFLFYSIFFLCKAEEKEDVQDIKIFQSIFKRKRLEHKEAVKSIMKHDQQKQYKLIDAISKKIFQVLEESQIKLRESGYVPGMPFPSDSKIRDALSLCLENTAFLSEILLHMPDITHEFLKAEKSRTLILTWGIFFASQSNFLDETTKKLIYLASQELSISERDPDYVNPYKSKKSDAFALKEKPLKKKERKKKTFKKGPRLSSQFGDL